MNNQRILLGKSGEKLAQKFFQKLGYKIIENNFRTDRGEIDIIAYDKENLVFIEVKTRRSNYFGTPAEAVGCVKQKKLRQMALIYLANKKAASKEIRFDVLEITFDKISYTPKFNLIKNAF